MEVFGWVTQSSFKGVDGCLLKETLLHKFNYWGFLMTDRHHHPLHQTTYSSMKGNLLHFS